MTARHEILRMLERYLSLFPSERAELARFVGFVDKHDGASLYDRKNFAGHITASGMIYDASADRLLLLEHVQLKKWLQPGGHVEATDRSIFEASLREVEEETGLMASQLECCGLGSERFPVIDLDSHYIPPCRAKGEAEHWHHDVRYLFVLREAECSLCIDPAESKAHRWMKVDEIPAHFGFGRLAPKIRRALGGNGSAA